MLRLAVCVLCISQSVFCLDTTKRPLSLTAVVRKHQIKKDASGRFYRLSLPVYFNLKNGGHGSIIVIKNALRITRVSIAGSELDLRIGKYLYDRAAYPSFKQMELVDPAQLEVEIVPANSSYNWNVEWWIYVIEKNEKSASSPELSLEALSQLDTAWISFEVSFFPITMNEEGLKLQNDLKDKGETLLDTIVSSPVRLELHDVALP